MEDITIDKEILKYISREKYLEVYYGLGDREHRVIYEANQLRISLTKVGKRVFTVKTYFGDKPIEEIVKNMMLIQAQF